MGKLLSLEALTISAQATFAANPTIDKVFATADDNIFLPDAHNAARNHARQEKLEVHEISRTGATSDDILDHIATDAQANELKHQDEAAEIAARSVKNTAPPATVVAVSVEAAAAAQAAGKTAAVEVSSKATDAPANDGVAVANKPKATTKPKAAATAKPKAATTAKAKATEAATPTAGEAAAPSEADTTK